ncbi:hypothetical protein PRIPAC_93022 [Pristionchus pacificus]|uniref:Uncharacterized protein n=1 Tax=Pristionchus pacificus TaxID=54126 RepID=A0A2A6BQA7_PRIPA|nr:hypothetical protein PRIPAC_93022 [Pristionchus pacificus]|eukprot:PDM67951.1 hypothetical protein PRIPAC_45995 [Pristionchus pacificus]
MCAFFRYMGLVHSCPNKDPQVIKELEAAQAMIEELQKKVEEEQKARNEELLKFYEKSLEREREHGIDRVQAAFDMKEATERMTEKMNEQQIKNTEKLIELMVIKEREAAQAKIEELQKKVEEEQKARNEELLKFYEKSLEREREHGNDRIQAALDMKEATERVTEKMNEQQIKNTEKLFELMVENDKVMARGIEYMQKVPLYVTAEEESKKLAPMLENVRANLSESREICGELFKMVAEKASDEAVKEKLSELSRKACDEGRTSRNEMLSELSNSRNIDSKLRDAATVKRLPIVAFHISYFKRALIQLNKWSDVLFKEMFILKYNTSAIVHDDILHLDSSIAQMQEVSYGITHLQGQSIAHRTMETMEQIHQDKRTILSGLATASQTAVKEEKSAVDRFKSFLKINREDKNAESEDEERMEQLRREREEADRRFNEKQMTLAIERNKIMNNYHMQSTMIKEKVSDELSRINDQSRRTEASFKEKLRAEDEERDRLIEEMRKRRRDHMAQLVRHLLFTYLSNEAEKEWSQKLSSLRNVHDPVRLRFTTLYAFISDQIKKGDLSLPVPYKHAMEHINNLKYDLCEERMVMEDAVLDMHELKIDNPQAKFLTDIEESAMSVVESATILIAKVAEVKFQLESGDHVVSLALLNECKLCFDTLERRVNTIPTVMDLRSKYENRN